MKNKQIKLGAVISYVAIFINIAAMMIYTPWVKDQIGIDNYGLYTLANSFISVFLIDFGIGSSVSRFIAKYRAENNEEGIRNVLGLVYKLYIFIDIVLFVILFVLFFFIKNIYVGLTLEELGQFKILYVIIAVFSLVSFPFTTLSGIFNAYEKFVPLKLCDLFQKLFSVVLVIIALAFDMGVVAIVSANVVSGICAIVIKLILLKRITPFKVNFLANDKMLLKEIVGFSVWVMILGIAQRLTYNIAPSILGIVSNTTQIALYSPASAIAGYFYTFATAVNGLFLPMISRKIASNKEDDILPLMIKVGRFQVVVLGLLWVGFFCIGKEFMQLWMGEEFTVAYFCAVILALPTIFEYSQQIANTTIIAKNKVKLQSIGLLCTAVLNVIIAPLLSYKWGAWGVSLSIVITAFLNLVYINIVYYKVLKINIFEFFKKCYVSILISIVVSIVVILSIFHVIPDHGWITLIIKGIITAIVFFISVFIFHIGKDEKKSLLKTLFRRRKNEPHQK